MSVDLSDPQDGLTVLVRSEPTKMGKTIGFCDMSITTLDGELLARGQHIKFLHMGILWNLLMHPFIAPLTVQLLTLFSSFLKPKHKSSKDLKFDDSVAGLYKGFGVTASPSDSSFSVPLASSLHNPLGALHGGALAMICEEVAVQSVPEAIRSSSAMTRMEVTYISSMKDCIKIDHNYSGAKRSDGNVRNKKNVLCAQFSCFWDDISIFSTR
jgi:acyl-coenzyme A thioesterase PaaI-like protein